jgi:hypothetical protein
MKKLLIVNTLVFALYTICGANLVYAQDTTKAKTVKPIVKPLPAKPGAVKYTTAQPYQAKPALTTAVPAAGATAGPGQVNPYAETPVSTDKSLSGQYQYVMSKTYHYQQPMIAALWKNISDTLRQTRKTLKEAQDKLAAQTQSVNSLQNDVKTKDQTLNDANAKRDEMDLLGLALSKGTYNLVMWGLVIGMGIILAIVIMKTAGASREAKYRTKLFDEVSEEFQAYKVKANDKEKKLARELQTERNKVDELMGRG